MPNVFTKPAGLEVRIGGYGLATNAAAAVVPEDVAAHLEQTAGELYRIERDAPPAPAPRLATAALKAAQKDKED